MNSVAVIGCGYVGLITGTVLACKHADKDFIFLDTNEDKIKALKEGKHYIVEPMFAGYYDIARNKKLTTEYSDIVNADVIIVAVNTPDDNGKCNLSFLYSTIESINKYAKQGAIVVIKSTVEVGTTKMLAETRFRKDLHVVNIPEFLVEGEAIVNMLNPSRVIIGYSKDRDSFVSSKLRALFYYVKDDKIVETDSNTSELSKLASNFMLAQRVASINAIESLAEEKNADIMDISKILRMDPRIGSLYLSPSAGFGGSCFRKDINNMSNICKDRTFSKFFMNVNDVNNYHMLKIVEKIGTNKRVLFLGYTFKESSNDTRDSPTKFIIDCLPKSVQYDVYDFRIEQYDKPPTGDYDVVILMLNEPAYIQIAEQFPRENVIDTKYVLC